MPEPTADYRHARDGAALFDVSDRGKVEVTGPDAAALLHNFSTNDVRNLPVGRACEAFFCTAQARVVAHGFIWHLLAETFWLDLAPGLAEKLVRHLGRYLISEQVELADRTAEHAQLHLAGPKAKETLDRATNGQAPDLGELQCATLALGEGSPLQIP